MTGIIRVVNHQTHDGVIVGEDGREYYFGIHDVGSTLFNIIERNTPVEFIPQERGSGEPRANHIRAL